MYKIVTKSVKPGQVNGLYSVLCLAQSMSRAAAKIANTRNMSAVEKQIMQTGGALIAEKWEIATKYMTVPGKAATKQCALFLKLNHLTDINIYIWGLSISPHLDSFIFIPLRRIGRDYNKGGK